MPRSLARVVALSPLAVSLLLTALVGSVPRPALAVQPDAPRSLETAESARPGGEEAALDRGDRLQTWDSGSEVSPGARFPDASFVLIDAPVGDGGPGPATDDDFDECSLLTEAELEAVTGLQAQPGTTMEVIAGGAMGCSWGTEPYDVRLYVSVATGSLAADGLGSEGEPVESLADAARWHYCVECLETDSSWSSNSLIVAQASTYLHTMFHPVDDEAGDQSEHVQATHREWAVELARLMLPRLAKAMEGSGGSTSDLSAYLASYGLTCQGDGAPCVLEVTDEDGVDATYSVLTRRDAAGDVMAIEAQVVSLDASMPSDAFRFLRGVAERAPVDDAAQLVAWLDTAVAVDAATPYRAGDWSAAWSAAEGVGGGETWRLAIVRDVAPADPEASPPSAPSEDEGSGVPAAPAEDAADRPFAASVSRPAEVSTDPIVILQSAALAGLLVFLMPFPSQLFNSTLEQHEDEVRRWLRLDRLGAAARGIGAFWSSWPGVAAFTILAALLYGFLDPGFGVDPGSLATFLGILLGIVLVTVAFAVPALLAHRRRGPRPTVKIVPVSLLVAVFCVLVSRLTGFQPGYLYGLLIGLAFASELSAADEGRTTAIGAALMLAAALLAWFGLGALPDGDGFALAVARTSLAALMVAGLEGVVFGLLPMRFLPGEPLYVWNRVLWGGLLAVGAFAFFHILINPASGYLSDTSRTPLFTVLALLVGFSVISVAFWAWFRFRGDSASDEVA